MEREPADRYGMCSSTHTAVVVRTRSPTTHTHHPHRQTPRFAQACTQQNSAQRDQSNADPTQDVTGSCWRRVLELVPSGPPARGEGVDSAPWVSRRWGDRNATEARYSFEFRSVRGYLAEFGCWGIGEAPQTDRFAKQGLTDFEPLTDIGERNMRKSCR